MSLNNKIALVTGASRGIGHAVLLELAKQGHEVIGTATTPQGASDISEVLEQSGYSGRGMVFNLETPSSIDALCDEIKDYAKAMPSILVNNAAITQDNIVLRMKESQWDKVLTINLSSVFKLTKKLIKPMVKARFGRVINLTSVVALTGNIGQANYTASKAGLIGMSKAIAQEVARYGVTVNNIAPGFIETDMTQVLSTSQREQFLKAIPMNTIGKPSDIAFAVIFLASDLASYITGQTLHINGGLYMA